MRMRWPQSWAMAQMKQVCERLSELNGTMQAILRV
jgi:hypothetical protein